MSVMCLRCDRTRNREAGFIWLESVLCGCLLLAMLGCLGLYVQAQRMEQQTGARMQAMALAQSELAYMQAAAAEQTLTPGQYNWLGAADWLELDGRSYQVQAKVQAEAAGNYQVEVTVNWQNAGTVGSFTTTGEVMPDAAAP